MLYIDEKTLIGFVIDAQVFLWPGKYTHKHTQRYGA